MSRPDIEGIRARCAAATPGPWNWRREGRRSWRGTVCGDLKATTGLVLYGMDIGCTDAWVQVQEEDAAFIARAREDIPALLAYIAELEAPRVLPEARFHQIALEVQESFRCGGLADGSLYEDFAVEVAKRAIREAHVPHG